MSVPIPMRRVIPWSALFVTACLAACQGERPTLTIVVANPPERAMAAEVTSVVAEHSTLQFEIVDVNPGESAADYLVDGRAQLAFATNGQPYAPEIASTVPLYTSVLHILYPADATLPTLPDLLNHENKFVGEANSSTLVLVRQIAALAGLDPETIASAAGARPHTTEVVFLLAPIGNSTRRLMRGHRFFSLGDPADIGKGTMAEGISTRIVQARPHVVSAWSYGLATPEPVLTLAVDTHIVMSQQLPEQAAYSFTQALVENKAQFSSSNSSLF